MAGYSETRSAGAAFAAQNRMEQDALVVERLARAGAPMYPAGEPTLTAIAIDDGQVRDLGRRHRRWRLLQATSLGAAGVMRGEAELFAAVQKPAHITHIVIRPSPEPVAVRDYRQAHKKWTRVIARSVEYLQEDLGALEAFLLVVHPRPCNGLKAVDLHVHVIGDMPPEKEETVTRYLRDRYHEVWNDREEGTEQPDVSKGRLLAPTCYYAEKNVAPIRLCELGTDDDLLALYEQTRRLKFSNPRGALRQFIAERKELDKKRKKRRRRPRHPRQPVLGSRIVSIAKVWHGRARMPSLIVETYAGPTHHLDSTSPSPHKSLSTNQETDTETKMLSELISDSARESLIVLRRAIPGVNYKTFFWPCREDQARCDQEVMLAVVRELLSPLNVLVEIEHKPSHVAAPLAFVEGLNSRSKTLEWRRHLETVSIAAMEAATRIVQALELVGRVATDQELSNATPRGIRTALVRAVLQDAGLVDAAVTALACNLAHKIAEGQPVAATQEAAGAEAPRTKPAAAGTKATTAPSTPPVQEAAGAEASRTKPAAAGTKATTAPSTVTINPETTNPDSADAAARSLKILASRPHMRADIYIWSRPPLSGCANQSAALRLVQRALSAAFPDFRTLVWPSASPVEPQYFVEVSGISAPPERAHWKQHVETIVAAAINAAISNPFDSASHNSSTPLCELLALEAYPIQKFNSDAERRLAALIRGEPSVQKWEKPNRGQFQIEYGSGKRYEPDFVVETIDRAVILEVSAPGTLDDPDVQAKAAAATQWCKAANDASVRNSKPWSYILLPADQITGAVTFDNLMSRFVG